MLNIKYKNNKTERQMIIAEKEKKINMEINV